MRLVSGEREKFGEGEFVCFVSFFSTRLVSCVLFCVVRVRTRDAGVGEWMRKSTEQEEEEKMRPSDVCLDYISIEKALLESSFRGFIIVDPWAI
jgi:hypothetical protein